MRYVQQKTAIGIRGRVAILIIAAIRIHKRPGDWRVVGIKHLSHHVGIGLAHNQHHIYRLIQRRILATLHDVADAGSSHLLDSITDTAHP